MEKELTTPHIGATRSQIAPRILMPGDPKRAQWIAKMFLQDAKLVSDIRGMTAYTGKYKGIPVTIFPHGMGIPSISIYSHELYTVYNAKVIYRVGSCGVTNVAKCRLGDTILAKSCWSDIPIDLWTKIKPDEPFKFYPSRTSYELIRKTAKKIGIPCKELDVFSSSFFYNIATYKEIVSVTKTSVTEMEGFGLFLEAKRSKTKAACLLTVSDNMETGEAMSAKERETTFKDMVILALESIIKEEI